MAQYTEFLYNIVDVYLSGDYKQLYGNISTNLPIEDDIRSKLYGHYKYFEIGYETAERFLYEFKIKYNELIPKIKLTYEAFMNENFKNLDNYAHKRLYQLARSAMHKNELTSSSNSQFKDTPYTQYSNADQYNTTVTDGSSSSLSDASTAQNDTYNEEISGYSNMTSAEAVKKYLDVWYDIELWVIKEFRDLFMEVY